jgi:hypothetical protein
MNLRSLHLIKFCGGGQVFALKSATALILDRCGAFEHNYTENYSSQNKEL